jgi:hypothetical protein
MIIVRSKSRALWGVWRPHGALALAALVSLDVTVEPAKEARATGGTEALEMGWEPPWVALRGQGTREGASEEDVVPPLDGVCGLGVTGAHGDGDAHRGLLDELDQGASLPLLVSIEGGLIEGLGR